LSDLSKAEAEFVRGRKEASRQEELFRPPAGRSAIWKTRRQLRQGEEPSWIELRKKTRILRESPSHGSDYTYTLRAPIDGEVITRKREPRRRGGRPVLGWHRTGIVHCG